MTLEKRKRKMMRTTVWRGTRRCLPHLSTPRSTGLSPKGASMDAQDHRERDTEMFRKPSCSQLTGYTLGRDTSTVEGAAQASL